MALGTMNGEQVCVLLEQRESWIQGTQMPLLLLRAYAVHAPGSQSHATKCHGIITNCDYQNHRKLGS